MTEIRPLEVERTGLAAAAPALDSWYRTAGRHHLPWRLTRDSYAVLVSEVMLQQTQVSRVLPAYISWLGRWPALVDLASASPGDVIRQWAGLGYNRRALNLHRAAGRLLANDFARVPADPGLLVSLPGVGRYTAAAVSSFAGERRVAVVDTNIARVLGRHQLGLPSGRDAPAAAIWRLAEALLPATGAAARDHNLALMDLGALVCRASAPRCEACPVAASCAWFAAGRPAAALAPARTPRFESTDRFARGRILDALRSSPRSASELAGRLPPVHAARLDRLLGALVRDGLVVALPEGAWALPGDHEARQGSTSIASPKL